MLSSLELSRGCRKCLDADAGLSSGFSSSLLVPFSAPATWLGWDPLLQPLPSCLPHSCSVCPCQPCGSCPLLLFQPAKPLLGSLARLLAEGQGSGHGRKCSSLTQGNPCKGEKRGGKNPSAEEGMETSRMVPRTGLEEELLQCQGASRALW